MKLCLRGLLSRVIFAASFAAAAAVKTQGGIALFENAKPLQCAGFFEQVEVAAMLGDYQAAGCEKFRDTKKF